MKTSGTKFERSKKSHDADLTDHTGRRLHYDNTQYHTFRATTSHEELVGLDPKLLWPYKSPLFASLYAERAKAWLRLKDYDASLKDCALVLYHQDDHVESWLTRFSALHGLKRHHEVLEETKELMTKWGQGNEQIRQALQKADFEVRKAKRPDYYGLLGVSSLASEKEIKKAYRQKALEYHPDRLSGAEHTDEQRKEASNFFQQLGDALEILTGELFKKLYDEGFDMEAIKERSEAAQRAARQKNHPH